MDGGQKKMSDTDMSNVMNQINNMLKNNEIPDDLKNIISSFSNGSSMHSSNNTND